MSTILSYADYIDWKTFIADKLGEDLRDRADAVRRAAPASIVASHAASVGLFASPNHWEGQADDWTMAKQVDYYGTSFYPKHSAFVDRDVPWRAALLDFTRSFAYDEGRTGFWVGELQGGFGTIAVNVSPAVSPADLRVWTWSAVARGAKGINYYAWYPMSSGYESGGFGLIDLDGTVTTRAEAAGAIARVIDRNQDFFLDAHPPHAEVAVVYDPLVHFVGGRQRTAAYGGPQGEVAGIERDSLLGVHRALFPINVPVDYVHIDHLAGEKLRGYKLVYFPYPVMVTEAAAQALTQYVRGGGALVAEARLAWNNARGYASERIPGLGLWEVTGCRETAIETAPAARTAMVWDSADLAGVAPGDRLAGRWFRETLEPASPAAHVVARFEDGAPAAVVSSFGRGRTLTLGSYLSAAYQATPTPSSGRFFAALLTWAGVVPPVEVSGDALEVRHLESGRDAVLFVFNHGARRSTSRILFRRPPGDYTATDIVGGGSVPLTRERDGVDLAVGLEANDVRVLRVTPRR